MDKPLSNMNFIFSDAINSPYIIELYAGDYEMIEETFEDVLREYDAFVERIITTYHEGDAGALKSAVHKIKPLFGFVGLTTIQALCLQFETACQKASYVASLAPAYETLLKQVEGAKSIIEGELTRLKTFNQDTRRI